MSNGKPAPKRTPTASTTPDPHSTPPAQTPAPPPAPQPAQNSPSLVQDACDKAKSWKDCWQGVGATTTPSAFGDDIYTVVPKNHWYAHTALTSNSLDVDGLVPTTITVDYKNQLKTIITDAGTGAAAGAALGPYGIAGGAIIGILGATQTSGTPKGPRFESFVCKEDFPADWQEGGLLTSPTFPLTLLLPVTITVSPALFQQQGSETPDKNLCWHLMPSNAQRFVEQSTQNKLTGYRGNGWLYRIKLDPKVQIGAITPDNYFAQAPASALNAVTTTPPANASDTRADFPYSTCRKATIEVIWWNELQDALTVNATTPSYQYLSFNTTIADPQHMGSTALPRAGTIKLKPLCGPSSVTKTETVSPLSDSAQELLKQIKAVKDAQSSKSSDSTTKGTANTKKTGS